MYGPPQLGAAFVTPAHGATASDGSRWMVNPNTPNAQGGPSAGWVSPRMWDDQLLMLARVRLGIQAFSAQDRPEVLAPVAKQIETESLALGHLPLIVQDIRFVQDPGKLTGKVVAGTLETPPPPPPPTVAEGIKMAAPSDAALRDYIVRMFAAYGIKLAPTVQGVTDWVNNLTKYGATPASFQSAVANWAPTNGGTAKPVTAIPAYPAAVAPPLVKTVVPVPVTTTVAKPVAVVAPAAAPAVLKVQEDSGPNWLLWLGLGVGGWLLFGRR